MLLRPTIPSEASDSLVRYTRPALIVPQLRERDTAGVVKELSQPLQQEGCVADVLAFYHAALNHEFLVNSAIEGGIAFPHARLHGVPSTPALHSVVRRSRSSGKQPFAPGPIRLSPRRARDRCGGLATLLRLWRGWDNKAHCWPRCDANQPWKAFRAVQTGQGAARMKSPTALGAVRVDIGARRSDAPYQLDPLRRAM